MSFRFHLLLFALCWAPLIRAQDQNAHDFSRGFKTTELEYVANVLRNEHHPNRNWVLSVYGRILIVNKGSGVVWSPNTTSTKEPVVISAMHVVGRLPPIHGESIPAELAHPGQDAFRFKTQFSNAEAIARPEVHESLALFHDAISPEMYGELFKYNNIPPSHDFALGIVSPKISAIGFIPISPGRTAQPQIVDPFQVASKVAPSTGQTVEGDPVIILGFPTASEGEMVYSIGKVAGTKRAAQLLENGKSNFPLDEKLEFVVEVGAAGGMSGGGAFDRYGRFLGILVRGGGASSPYTRILKASYIGQKLRQRLDERTNDFRILFERAVDPDIYRAQTSLQQEPRGGISTCRSLFE